MTFDELFPHLITLALGLVGGGGIASLVKAKADVFVLGADGAIRSLQAALAEADGDKAELRKELAAVKAELATERQCREELGRRLAKLERNDHGSH